MTGNEACYCNYEALNVSIGDSHDRQSSHPGIENKILHIFPTRSELTKL